MRTRQVRSTPGHVCGRIWMIPSRFRLFCAWFYDALITVSCVLILTTFFVVLMPGEWISEHPLDFWLMIFTSLYLLVVYSWYRRGQTLGYRAWRLQLTSISDKPLSWRQCSWRFFLGAISWTLGGLGHWWAFFSPSRRTVMDYLTQTKTELMESGK